MYNRTFLIKVKNKKVMPNLLDTTFFYFIYSPEYHRKLLLQSMLRFMVLYHEIDAANESDNYHQSKHY